jgi:hypothetical protein
MNPRQPSAKTKGDLLRSDEAPGPARCLTLLAEGAASATPEIEQSAYQEFRAAISTLAMQVRDSASDQEKLAVIKEMLQCFETHRNASETAMRERLTGWRNLTARLLRELLGGMGIEAGSMAAAPLVAGIKDLLTFEDIRNYQESLDDFLRPRGANGSSQSVSSPLKTADRTTSNTNAAGLRGGGAAVEYLGRALQRGARGFAVLFQLGCMDMIHERFGLEAVEDCLMSVSAHLTQSLHSDDAIFHWSDSSLMAIMLGRGNEQILHAELNRIASRNRDIAISVSGRTIMVRVPLEYNFTPISRLHDGNDLYKFSQEHATKW